MAKQKSDAKMFIFSLGFGSDTDDLFRTYIEEIVNGKLREYQAIIQRGAKAGQSLYLHILNGICVLERLRPILNLEDIEVQVLFSAYSVHDLNKLSQFQDERRSFNYLANAKNVSTALTNLKMERFFPEWQDYLKDIEVLVRAHSRYHNTYDETLDLNYDPYSLERKKLLEYLIPIIRAMDVIDLSKTLEECAKKQDFLKEINSLHDVKYKFVYHKVSEQRGILTNLIHNEIARYLETEKNLLPLLYYPNGVAYLVDENRDVRITQDEVITISNLVIGRIKEITCNEFRKFITSGNQGIKIDKKCMALGVSFSEIWNEVKNKINRKKYNVDDMNAKCLDRLEKARNKLRGTEQKPEVVDVELQDAQLNLSKQQNLIDEILSNEDAYLLPPNEDAIRLGEMIRTYYIFLNKHSSKKLANAWEHIYNLLRLPSATEDPTCRQRYAIFGTLYDRGYIIGRDLYNAKRDFDEIYELIVHDGSQILADSQSELETPQSEGEFGTLVDYVYKHADFDFAINRGWNFATNLKRYVKNNHVQCSTCGSEFDTGIWKKADVSANIKVQQFSNRLEGGASREPKRRVCSVCRIQYMLDKLCYNVNKSTTTFFIHLFSPSFFTDVLINAFKAAQERLLNADFSSIRLNASNVFRTYQADGKLELEFNWETNNGNPLPKFSEALGNILTIPVNAPGDNHTEKVLFAVENALIYQRFLGCRAVLTDSSIPLFTSTDNHLFIDHIPPALCGWLSNNSFNSEETQLVFKQLQHLCEIQAEIESDGYTDLVRLIRTLNSDVLELYHVTHRMIKRKYAGKEKEQFTTVRNIAEPIANIVAMKGEEPIMIHIQELARIAWEGSLRGDTFNDNSLARALDVAFKSLKRWSRVQKHETKEVARAILSQDIERAIKRTTEEPYFGKKKLSNISQFVTVLFDHIYEEDYQGNLTNFLDNRNRIRAAYLHFIKNR